MANPLPPRLMTSFMNGPILRTKEYTKRSPTENVTSSLPRTLYQAGHYNWVVRHLPPSVVWLKLWLMNWKSQIFWWVFFKLMNFLNRFYGERGFTTYNKTIITHYFVKESSLFYCAWLVSIVKNFAIVWWLATARVLFALFPNTFDWQRSV